MESNSTNKTSLLFGEKMKIIKRILFYLGLIPAITVAVFLAWPSILYMWAIKDDDFSFLQMFATLGLVGIWIFVLLCVASYFKI